MSMTKKLHEEFNNIWQININNTSLDDIDSIIDDDMDDKELKDALNSYEAVVISKEEYDEMKDYADRYKGLLEW